MHWEWVKTFKEAICVRFLLGAHSTTDAVQKEGVELENEHVLVTFFIHLERMDSSKLRKEGSFRSWFKRRWGSVLCGGKVTGM